MAMHSRMPMRSLTATRSPTLYGRAYRNIANTNMASQQCTRRGAEPSLQPPEATAGVLGVLLGGDTSGRVVSVTQVTPRNNGGWGDWFAVSRAAAVAQ